VRLYTDLTAWYRLIDPPADHEEEASVYAEALMRCASGPAATLLELGSGAGHNALFLKRRFRCTLADVSEPMLALSRELNPDCEHLLGDMRTLRLDRRFDAVFVHDAVCYLTTIGDLRRMADTAFAHTRPGGAALFAPDYVKEAFRERAALIAGDDGSRSLRGLEWAWDPDPADSSYRVEYTFLLRDGSEMTTIYDPHVEGLFTIDEWRDVLTVAGYEVTLVNRPLGEAGETDNIFACRRQV
jgi:SAM-dependent methyltransferase